MKEYIEREAFIKRLEVTPILRYGIPVQVRDGVIDLAEKQPAADVVERKRGRWVDRYGGKYANHLYECSECKGKAPLDIEADSLGAEHIIQARTNFCPHCGADMREVDHEGNNA